MRFTILSLAMLVGAAAASPALLWPLKRSPWHTAPGNRTDVSAPKARLASRGGPSNDPWGKAGDYDFLQLARFWMGEPADSIPCGSYASQNLTLHGIWPQYNEPQDGGAHGWPQFCNVTAPFNTVSAAVSADLINEWRRVAPSYPKGSGKPYDGLAQHEWERHGTCWSAAIDEIAPGDHAALVALQERFFAASLRLNEAWPTPALLRDAQASGKPVALEDLQAAFGGAKRSALQCTKEGQLSMVMICVDKAMQKRVDCPAQTLESTYDNSCVVPKRFDEVKVHFDCAKGAV
jgi:ribonuclease T2